MAASGIIGATLRTLCQCLLRDVPNLGVEFWWDFHFEIPYWADFYR